MQYRDVSPAEEGRTYQITININYVTLKAKFPCRMFLQHSNLLPTEQVTCTPPHNFHFDHQFRLRLSKSTPISQISVNLRSQKGSVIRAGTVRLLLEQIKDCKGQLKEFEVKNCMDATAKCQIRIVKVQIKQSQIYKQRNNSNKKPTQTEYKEQTNQQTFNKKYQKSPLKYSKTNQNPSIRIKQYQIQQSLPELNKFTTAYHVPGIKISQSTDFGSNGNNAVSARDYLAINQQKPRFLSYSKTERNLLKSADVMQDSLRQELSRSKSRIEDLEKGYQEKSRQVRKLIQEIGFYKIEGFSKQYYDEEIDNKNKQIINYQTYLYETRKQNQSLQFKIIDLEKQLNSNKEIAKYQIQKLKSQLENKYGIASNSLSCKHEDIQYLRFQIQRKQEKLNKLKKMIEQFQDRMEQRQIQFEKLLKVEKQSTKKKIQVLTQQIKCIEAAFKIEEITNQQLKRQIEDLKQKLNKKEIECIFLKQSITNYESNQEIKVEDKQKAKILIQQKRALENELSIFMSQHSKCRDRICELQKKNQDILRKCNQIQKIEYKQACKIKEYELQLKSSKENENQMKDLIKNKNQKIIELTKSLQKAKNAQSSINQKTNKLFMLQSEAQLLKQLSDKQKQIDACKNQIDELNQNSSNKLIELQNQNASNKKTIQMLTSNLQQLNQLLESKDKKLEDLSLQLEDTNMKFIEMNNKLTQMQRIIQADARTKEELKLFNAQLINKKEELGKAEAYKSLKIVDLQKDNITLKTQIQTLLQDYKARTDAIQSLKQSLSSLNLSIRRSQQESISMKEYAERYTMKIKENQKKIKEKDQEIQAIQLKYKEIIKYYSEELEKVKQNSKYQKKEPIFKNDAIKKRSLDKKKAESKQSNILNQNAQKISGNSKKIDKKKGN